MHADMNKYDKQTNIQISWLKLGIQNTHQNFLHLFEDGILKIIKLDEVF